METAPELDDAQAEHALVEGCGALLGLLLIDHLQTGRHIEHEGAHRVRLGRFGDFDPFAAVEQALDAEDLRASLAGHVARAEAEAREEGPLSRVLAALHAQLPEAAPGYAIHEHFEHRVWLRPEGEIDLRALLRATDGEERRQVDGAVRKLLRALGGEGESRTWEDARPRLFPRLVSERFATEMTEAAGEIWIERVAGDLHRAMLLRFTDRSRYVRAAEIRQWGLTPQDAWRAALRNLAEHSGNARLARVDTSSGPLVLARSGDGLDAARLMLPTLHALLEPQLGSPFVAAVPHRDLLLACAAEPPALVESLRQRAHEEALRAPHAISEALFRIDSSGAPCPFPHGGEARRRPRAFTPTIDPGPRRSRTRR